MHNYAERKYPQPTPSTAQQQPLPVPAGATELGMPAQCPLVSDESLKESLLRHASSISNGSSQAQTPFLTSVHPSAAQQSERATHPQAQYRSAEVIRIMSPERYDAFLTAMRARRAPERLVALITAMRTRRASASALSGFLPRPGLSGTGPTPLPLDADDENVLLSGLLPPPGLSSAGPTPLQFDADSTPMEQPGGALESKSAETKIQSPLGNGSTETKSQKTRAQISIENMRSELEKLKSLSSNLSARKINKIKTAIIQRAAVDILIGCAEVAPKANTNGALSLQESGQAASHTLFFLESLSSEEKQILKTSTGCNSQPKGLSDSAYGTLLDHLEVFRDPNWQLQGCMHGWVGRGIEWARQMVKKNKDLNIEWKSCENRLNAAASTVNISKNEYYSNPSIRLPGDPEEAMWYLAYWAGKYSESGADAKRLWNAKFSKMEEVLRKHPALVDRDYQRALAHYNRWYIDSGDPYDFSYKEKKSAKK